MAITIRLAGKGDQVRWDDFVHAQEGMGPYHLFGWKTAVEKAYHHTSHYLIAEDEKGRIQGVLPLILIKPPLLRGCMVSLPFCDYGGALAVDRATEALLIRKAVDLARSHRANLEIRCKSASVSFLTLPRFDVTSHKSRMVLPLSKNSETLFRMFKSKLRSQIRRPQKEGMLFRMGSRELLDDFYRVFSRNMRELGSPVHAKDWLCSVVDSFDGKAHVGMVYSGRVPVAGGVILSCNDTVTVPWASSLSQYNRLSPNMLLYWGFLQYASDNGFKRFDFGRSTPGEGTYRFKEQWGAEPSPLYWYSVNTNGTNPARRYIERTWAFIPQSFTDRIGPLLRRYIRL
jgi:FemAB-related protein (PEP-CTERM system-associated)